MPSSTTKQLLRLLEAVEILHDHSSEPFTERVLIACTHFKPETLHSYELWDKESGAHEGGTDVPLDEAGRQELFELMGTLGPKQHPVLPHIAAGVDVPLRLYDVTTRRQFRMLDLYELVFKPTGCANQACIPLRDGSHVGGITFSRDGRDFTDTDMELFAMLGRHLVLAHRTSQILRDATAGREALAVVDDLPLRQAGLTRREAEVLHWIAEGKRDKEIAVILGISYRTVTVHVRSILGKLGVENRTSAASAVTRMRG
ncbi:MAG TPA: helix-turn-helix transcriptional regulator [Bacteroidia bacterium]|nr:helix-turn-helix transcriptional regulator [Bacteroidia bacterium]